MSFQRAASSQLLKLASQYPVVTLTGPRQSGKTTLVRELFKGFECCRGEKDPLSA